MNAIHVKIRFRIINISEEYIMYRIRRGGPNVRDFPSRGVVGTLNALYTSSQGTELRNVAQLIQNISFLSSSLKLSCWFVLLSCSLSTKDVDRGQADETIRPTDCTFRLISYNSNCKSKDIGYTIFFFFRNKLIILNQIIIIIMNSY